MLNLKQLFSSRGNGGAKTLAPRPRLKFERLPDRVYAIGDVHGFLDLLVELEDKIVRDCTPGSDPATIIMLGDYVDRGADSAGVIEHLIASKPDGMQRHCLMGNHEAAMLSFLNAPDHSQDTWLDYGGYETLLSYGVTTNMSDLKPSAVELSKELAARVPAHHLEFLSNIPVMIEYPEHVFVHAGVRPNIALADQVEKDLLWIRSDFIEFDGPLEKFVVHGHTPVSSVEPTQWRANVDTGAYATGHLSALKFVDGKIEDILST